MGNTGHNEYHPDAVSPPGETLLETLEIRGMSQAELAERTGRPRKTINEIIKGKAAITPETALQFERVLGVPSRFWNQREQQYREFLAQQQEQHYLEQHVDWLKQIPVRAMIKQGWIQSRDGKVAQLREVLQFFGIASPNQWHMASAAFRKSPACSTNEGALAAWLRRGEIMAQDISCAAYDQQAFTKTLEQIRTLTRKSPDMFVPELTRLCAAHGVAVVFVPELPGTSVCGATRWLTSTRALIQLSLRYKTDDQLWFSFFHEAGHIVLHNKRAFFLETEKAQEDQAEKEANRFAADMLIAPAAWRNFLETKEYRSKAVIRFFADELGIAPGIIVGRLQHEKKIPFRNCNDLKQRFAWVQDTE